MRSRKKYIALDLGGSARCVVGAFDGQILSVETISHFTNPYVRVLDQVYWNVLELFDKVKDSLQQVNALYGKSNLTSLGVDTMGVAFALLDGSGELLGNPQYSRLPQRKKILTEAYRRSMPDEIYQQTGLQPSRLNSLYGLLAMKLADSPMLNVANTFLMLPDLINYWLTGRIASEYTIASTSHLLGARTKSWAYPLIADMQLPAHIFPEIIDPGQVFALLHSTVAAETGLPTIPVVATAAHDTAAAVASVPATQPNFAYLSSGTWGMVGAELGSPILTTEAQQLNFANEGGVEQTIRFINNNLNLWLIQECQRIWGKQGKTYGWNELVAMAELSMPFMALIDPNAADFFLPANMPRAIQRFCQRTRQDIPQTPGQIVRTILESLAIRYRQAIDNLSAILDCQPQVIHLIGGGGRNRLLNQFAANATGLPVIVGPFEATSIGNILVQMIAVGDLASLKEGRALVNTSFLTETYLPADSDIWEEQFNQWKSVFF